MKHQDKHWIVVRHGISRLVTIALMLLSSINSAVRATPGAQSTESSGPISVEEAAKSIEAPNGFKVTLFAHEPDVHQPIAMTTDERGRLWVAENFTYADQATNFDLQQKDRIVIFEDTDGDGRFDNRTVFWSEGKKLTSIEIGNGGVWALCAPQLIFIPDRDRDDRPDGPPEVVLDGWDDDLVRHNIVNGLKWGPDGWLYGRHGILATSLVGAPGAVPAERKKLNCGIWRYHPQSRIFEVVAHGTTNPWGMDFDDHGEMFFINTVIGHLWHLVPGAHYERMYGADLNPYAYGLIGQCADHYHWDTGEKWSDVQKGISDTTLLAGGGHAHSGLMIYLGDNWPVEYRNSAFTLNFHGRRVNNDTLERHESGYIAKHGKDLFLAKDDWFRGIELIYGPDGGVFVADWSDTGECHNNDAINRTSGRIYKIAYKEPTRPGEFNLSNLDDEKLVELQLHANDWYVRQSRRLLQQRAENGQDMSNARGLLLAMFDREKDDRRQLRALWALHAIGGLDETWLRERLVASSEHVRAWAIRLLADQDKLSEETISAFVRAAQSDPSGLVRLYLASTLQRLPIERRWGIATALAEHREDSGDRQLPLMIWYGIEQAVPANPQQAVALCSRDIIPLVRRNISRRLTSDAEESPQPVGELVELIRTRSDTEFQLDILRGMFDALRGWRKAPAPSNWTAVAESFSANPSDEVKELTRQLGVVFGDGRGAAELRHIATDTTAEIDFRRNAVRSLAQERAADTLPLLKQLAVDIGVAGEAVRGLAGYDDPTVPELILSRYQYLDPQGKIFAVDTLSSRPSYAKALLEAVATGRVPKYAITASHARQIGGFNDDSLLTTLKSVWGSLRVTNQERRDRIDQLTSALTPEHLAHADVSNGRLLFDQACSVCHVLYGNGKQVGPDLTGSNRSNLSYLLENVIDPSATVSSDFRVSVVETIDGRMLTGVVLEKNERTIKLKNQTEEIVLSLEEIENMEQQDVSLMPDGLLTQYSDEQIANLFAYLMTRSQVPLPKE